MRTINILGSIGLTLFLIIGSTPMGMAGVEPSPFMPEINQLNASVNMLESIDHKLIKTMEKPPLEGTSAHNINGALNKLEGIDRRLLSVGSMADSIFEDIVAVMGFEPSPFNDPDLIGAFEAVKAALEQIQDTANRQLPLGVVSEFIDALGLIEGTVIELAGEVESYIYELENPPTECVPADFDEFGCMENADCVWITSTDPAVEPYCCCFPE
jgi:hypothetical protein